MQIKIRYIHSLCKLTRNGNMYDLRTSKPLILNGPTVINEHVIFDDGIVPLGIAMDIPKYFEANIIPRSSLFNNYKVILANSIGEIDGPDDTNIGYTGTNDIWHAQFIALSDTIIPAGAKVCQFRIRPTMDAPIWVKLKWLFTNKITFKQVDILNVKNRGGFGTTGK